MQQQEEEKKCDKDFMENVKQLVKNFGGNQNQSNRQKQNNQTTETWYLFTFLDTLKPKVTSLCLHLISELQNRKIENNLLSWC